MPGSHKGALALAAAGSKLLHAHAYFSYTRSFDAALFFGLFFAASRLSNKILRVFLFWIPTLTVSVLCITIVALITYLFVRARHP
jgi:hypothetical protein